jgi:ubiquinone/menaquinone biosynthesis C-methylase UbiE
MTETQKNLLNGILSKVGDLGFRRRVIKILNWLNPQKEETLLDCGCGEGFYSMVLSEVCDGTVVTAFDYNAELLAKASRWTAGKRISFKNGNIEKGLPFESNAFDKVIFTEVLEHLDDDRRALAEIYRVMKPSGLLALTVPNANYPFLWDPINWTRESLGLGHFNPKNTILGGVWSYDHKRLYSFDQIRTIAKETGFEIVEEANLTHFCMPFNYLILRFGKILTGWLPQSSVKSATEKFEWKKKEDSKGMLNQILQGVFSVFKKVDQRNDLVEHDPSYSSISVGLLLRKPRN